MCVFVCVRVSLWVCVCSCVRVAAMLAQVGAQRPRGDGARPGEAVLGVARRQRARPLRGRWRGRRAERGCCAG